MPRLIVRAFVRLPAPPASTLVVGCRDRHTLSRAIPSTLDSGGWMLRYPYIVASCCINTILRWLDAATGLRRRELVRLSLSTRLSIRFTDRSIARGSVHVVGCPDRPTSSRAIPSTLDSGAWIPQQAHVVVQALHG